METDKQRVEEILWKKKILVGHTKISDWDKQRHPVYLEAEIKKKFQAQKRIMDLKKVKGYKTFSISGYSKNFGGQIRDELNPENIDFAVDPLKVKKIKSIWKQWHLNDLKAGTLKQEMALKGMKKYDYDKAVKRLQKKGLHKDRGYQYGTSWLVNPLPKKVENKIRKLF